MKRLLSLVLKVSISIMLTLALLEISLRLFPGVIPLDLLVYFQSDIKERIARNRGLPVESDTVALERDDGGPPLRVFKPFASYTTTIEDDGSNVTVTMDQIGFCNSPDSYKPAHMDIITIGDSFTQCHAVRPGQTWTSQLAALSGLTTYNLGRGKTGLHEYLQILKRFGLQKAPLVVVMNIYEGNDLRDAQLYVEYSDADSAAEPDIILDAEAAAEPTGQEWLAHNILRAYSFSYNLGQSTARYIRNNRYRPDQTNFRYSLRFADNQVIAFNPSNADRDEVEFARQLHDATLSLKIQFAIEAALAEFVTLSKMYGFVPVVTYTPMANITYRDWVEYEDPSLTELMPWFSQEQRSFLKAHSEKYGYTFIDLTPALQAAAHERGGQELLYFRYDLHLTPAGHEVIARALAPALADIVATNSVKNEQ